MIDIFLSRPTWVGDNFKKGVDNFLRFLKSHELNPRTLGSSDYPSDSPLDEVISLMEKCSGAIILGYPQITITQGTLKGEKFDSEMLLPTEWNHIEAGLAYARHLPILLIHHLNIRRGVFDRGAVNKFLYEIDLSNSDWPLDERISGALESWLPKVKGFNAVPAEHKLNAKTVLPTDSVVIGSVKKQNLATDIRAKIVLNDNTQPHVELFLDRIQRTSPYCPKCFRPLDTKHASWMADGVQTGYECKSCQTEYDGKYRDVLNEVKAEVRRDFDKYWKIYCDEIEKMTNGKPENFIQS